jgi:phenylpropionate dioxygenase-like ring-hydroxylating dioxygenase large terminal subunit
MGGELDLLLENLADPMHGPFLHGQSLTLGRGALEDDMRTTRTADGFMSSARTAGVNFDWSEFYCKDAMWVRLDIPLPFGPKGILRILCFATPIDEHRTLVYFLRYRKLAGWQRAYWRFLYRTFGKNSISKLSSRIASYWSRSAAPSRALRSIWPTPIEG